MSQINDGDPAYPGHDQGTHGVYGMSLRDAFAVSSLPVVAPGCHIVGKDFLHPADFEDAARDAYKMADAMLKARAITQPDRRCEYCDGAGDVHDLLEAARAAEAIFTRQKFTPNGLDPEGIALGMLRTAIARAAKESA